MMRKFLSYCSMAGFIVLTSCEACNEPETEVNSEISWANDVTVFETALLTAVNLEVRLNSANTREVSVEYATIEGSATAGEDFVESSGSLVFAPGETAKTISIPILSDDYLEPDESFQVELKNAINGYIKVGEPMANVSLRNDDTNIFISDEGYEASTSYDGMSLTWADEFDGEAINPANWTYDLGSGNGGWGNNELQSYSNSSNNSFVGDGKLFIVAEKVGENAYASARLKSLGLKEFQYGRIDVRAMLPKGQGVWPAIWMLGANYPDVGWPACGEIDIMELLGHLPGTVHGTAHWGADWPSWTHQGATSSIYPEHFDEEFHLFSIEWEQDQINFLRDDQVYFTITPSMMQGQPYPFNNPFFFILNVAVGGNWPGNPDESSEFPVFMAVDYVRVYQ
ncbi:MAG: glycoside hydrolase [Crocinitomicaceae bacterium]|nr:glycoside hydrolase [Crocinitomicaceae bacterium]|tara:strand:+ start:1511 stop:2701 length:1191 start_codon:yes stop_codon:yes gene_type:complete